MYVRYILVFMESLVFLLVFYSLLFLRLFVHGVKHPGDGCGNGYYAKELPRNIKYHEVRGKNVLTEKKHVCRQCGSCMDGLKTVAECTKWADTICGSCIYEDLGFVFDVITKSCQHPDVLNGLVAPDDIWIKLRIKASQPTQKIQLQTSAVTGDLPFYPLSAKFVPSATFSDSESELSAFTLTFFASAILLSLSLFVLVVFSCKLKAAQDGAHTLFPCVVIRFFIRICFTRRTHRETYVPGEPTTQLTTSITVSPEKTSTYSSWQKQPGNILQQSKDSKFPDESTSVYQLNMSESLHSFPGFKSKSCHNFGYELPDCVFMTTLWSNLKSPQPVDFYIGDDDNSSEDSFTHNPWRPRLIYDTNVSDYISTSSDVSVSDDEYGAWRAFNASKKLKDEENIESEIYLPSITSV